MGLKSLLLSLGVGAMLGLASAQAANLSIDFNHDAIGQPPPEGQCIGGVKIVQHPMKQGGDLSVELAWKEAKDKPQMTLTPEDHKLPLRGILRLDMLISKHGGSLEIAGLSNRGRTMFRFLIDGEGRAWTIGADESRNQILCVAAPPELEHWYNVCVTYDLPSRLFNVVLDNFWKSPDTSCKVIVADEAGK